MLKVIGGAQEGEFKAVASGTLPNGKPVVVNADGTVSVAEETTTSATEALGSAAVFDGSGVDYLSSTYDTVNDKFVIVYRDSGNSYRGTAVVGTVSGTSVSFGTPVAFSSNQSVSIACTFDPVAGKVVIIFRDTSNSSSSKCVAGTVSGTSISFGTVTQFAADYIDSTNLVYDSNSNKVVAVYNIPAAGTYGKAVVLTYSGSNSYTGGTGVVWASANSQALSACFDSDRNQIIIAFVDYSNSQRGTTIVGTVSGTSISFSTETVFENDGIGTFDGSISIVYNTTFSRVVIGYCPLNTNDGEVALGSNSGTSVGIFSRQVFNSQSSNSFVSLISDEQANGVVATYRDNGNSSYGTYRVCTFNSGGTAFTFGSETVYETATTGSAIRPAIDQDSSKILIAYQDSGNSNSGTGIVLQNAYSKTVTNLTSENYIGISSGGTYASGSNATVKIIGNTANVPERNYALDTASYDNKSADVNDLASVLTPRGLAFNADGSRMFTTETGDAASAQACYQFDLSTNFDVSTASYNNVSLNVSNASANRDPMGIAFNTDGTRLFVVGSQSSADGVFQYNLSTGFNLSTGSDSNLSVDTSSQDSFPKDLAFNSDGTKMFLLGSENDKVSQYTLSSAFTINTASFDSVDLDVSSQEASPTGLAFNSDGTQLFVGGFGDNVHMYNLSSAFNLSTASYSGVTFDVSSQVATPLSLEFNATGTKMYVAKSPGEVLQYSTSFSLTAGQSHFVQTDGTIGLTADDPSVFAGTAISATKLIVKT